MTTGTRLTPEAGGPHLYNPNYTISVNWTNTVTNLLLLEAGGTARRTTTRWTSASPGWDHTSYRITDQALNLIYGNVATRTIVRKQNQERFAMLYVTGSHQFSTGLSFRLITIGNIDELGHDGLMHGTAVDYRFNNGVPNQLTMLDAPWNFEESTRDIAIFAQDQWTIGRLTMNLGVRFNDARGSTPLQVLGAATRARAPFRPAGQRPGVPEPEPAAGHGHDLFGTGRTALKATLGHYPDIIRAATANPAAAV